MVGIRKIDEHGVEAPSFGNEFLDGEPGIAIPRLDSRIGEGVPVHFEKDPVVDIRVGFREEFDQFGIEIEKKDLLGIPLENVA